jgi:hypothetical protein
LVVLGAVRDTTLFESDTGSLGNGAGSYLFAGTTASGFLRRGLIAFDVASAIPAGSIIDSVRLTLHMSRTPAATEFVSLHHVNAAWGEGGSIGFGEDGGGAPAMPGDATWLHRYYPGDPWSQSGGDFDPDPLAETLVLSLGFYHWGTTPALAADVQGWLDHPESNFGWLLRGNEEFDFTAKRFDTHENPDPAVQPMLAIEYTPVPEPGRAMAGIFAALACIRPRRRR